MTSEELAQIRGIIAQVAEETAKVDDIQSVLFAAIPLLFILFVILTRFHLDRRFKVLATREEIQRLTDSLEQARHEVYSKAAIQERRWDLKRDIYLELLQAVYEQGLNMRALRRIALGQRDLRPGRESIDLNRALARYKLSFDLMARTIVKARIVLSNENCIALNAMAYQLKEVFNTRKLRDRAFFDEIEMKLRVTRNMITHFAHRDLGTDPRVQSPEPVKNL